MTSVTEEELKDKIRHYDQKEKDLVDRERLFELRMKEMYESFNKEKHLKE